MRVPRNLNLAENMSIPSGIFVGRDKGQKFRLNLERMLRKRGGEVKPHAPQKQHNNNKRVETPFKHESCMQQKMQLSKVGGTERVMMQNRKTATVNKFSIIYRVKTRKYHT